MTDKEKDVRIEMALEIMNMAGSVLSVMGINNPTAEQMQLAFKALELADRGFTNEGI